MWKLARCLPIVLLLSACASFSETERMLTTRFSLVSDTEWVFSVNTTTPYAPDDESAEVTRLQWLQSSAASRGCINVETKSRYFRQGPSRNKDVGTVTYAGTGNCAPVETTLDFSAK